MLHLQHEQGDYDSDECPILHPYDDDPDTHLRWIGCLVSPQTPDRGRLPITRLDLNRPELLYQRGVRVLRALEILEMIDQASAPVATALREDLRAIAADDAEYAAAVRSVTT
jgi:hypothetical protein